MLPGTGRMAKALAKHFCRAGLHVLVGSRDPSKAEVVATSLNHHLHEDVSGSATFLGSSSTSLMPMGTAVGLPNRDVASRAQIIVWSPRGTLEERASLLKELAPHLHGKIIVDVSNIGYCIDEAEWGQSSSTLFNQAALGVDARWTTAFKATFAHVLENGGHEGRVESTIVCGDDADAVKTTIALVETVPGFVGIHGGGLKNTKILELLGPPWLIELDKLNAHGSHSSGWHYVT
ncbi:hypothetical protein KP509_22G071700 [Ceratopteris richardii]|nr:hypothetical protein KP509_22G071700 [Ceratopteris richardii]